MSSIDDRIAQWEQMAREAPDDMAFFSLANAYKEAGRTEDAADAIAKAIELNEGMSRAYQLRGQMLLELERDDEALDTLNRGYVVAAGRGDVMPQRAIASLLKAKLGAEPPEVETPDNPPDAEALAAGGDTVLDRRTGRPQPRMPDPPMRGPTGEFIYDHFGQETWREWIGQGTKVINELRLDFSNPAHQETYEQYMLEWLQVTPDEIAEYHESKSD